MNRWIKCFHSYRWPSLIVYKIYIYLKIVVQLHSFTYQISNNKYLKIYNTLSVDAIIIHILIANAILFVKMLPLAVFRTDALGLVFSSFLAFICPHGDLGDTTYTERPRERERVFGRARRVGRGVEGKTGAGSHGDGGTRRRGRDGRVKTILGSSQHVAFLNPNPECLIKLISICKHFPSCHLHFWRSSASQK